MLDDRHVPHIDLIAIDIDGTLLTSDHQILPQVKQAFSHGREAGLHLVLASARSPAALRHILAELDHAGPCICFSGGWIGAIDPKNASAAVTSETTIPLDVALLIVDLATSVGLSPSWHNERHWAVPELSPTVDLESQNTRQRPIVTSAFAEAGAPNKILFIGDHEVLVGFRSELGERFGTCCNAMFSHLTYLEIIPKHVDKSRAVLTLAESLGVPPTAIAAVGDAENDIGMISSAAYGVAMGNAIDSVKGVARWVTSTNNEGGVARLIDQVLAHRRG
jgi:Cof subfamily protein (haloacid dehalogenase superfamily)